MEEVKHVPLVMLGLVSLVMLGFVPWLCWALSPGYVGPCSLVMLGLATKGRLLQEQHVGGLHVGRQCEGEDHPSEAAVENWATDSFPVSILPYWSTGTWLWEIGFWVAHFYNTKRSSFNDGTK